MIPYELSLLAVIDPHRAVAAVEAMPEPSDLEARGANQLRIRLSEQLGSNDEMFWNRTGISTRAWGMSSGGGIFSDSRLSARSPGRGVRSSSLVVAMMRVP